MDVDFAELPPWHRHKLLAGFVVPRPIALVTTVDGAGVVNAAPYSFFNCFGTDPGLVILNVGDRPKKQGGGAKDTTVNAEASGAFVVNTVDAAMAEAMNATSAPLPPGQSEVPGSGFTLCPCPGMEVPRIAEAPASLACRTLKVESIGNNRLLYGEVVAGAFREGLVEPGSWHVDAEGFSPLSRLGPPDWYARNEDRFAMKRPDAPGRR